MLVFVDTEFTDFIQIDLISIALVSDDGREFYAERNDYRSEDCSDFVRAAVVPMLGRIAGAACTRAELTSRLRAWFEKLPEPATLVYDYATDRDLLVDAFLGDEFDAAPANVGNSLLLGEVERDPVYQAALDFAYVEDWPRHHALSDARAMGAGYRAWQKANRAVFLFLDTEFTGLDQEKPDLISIALVDETGREFYAELPPSHYAVQCDEWVHFNVLPHLSGGDHVQSVADIRERLAAWIAGIQGHAVVVTDCPNADFRLLRSLLPDWPANLAPAPILFTRWSMDDDGQPEIHARMARYHTPERPAHHALHDANSLRIGALYALENGWQP